MKTSPPATAIRWAAVAVLLAVLMLSVAPGLSHASPPSLPTLLAGGSAVLFIGR